MRLSSVGIKDGSPPARSQQLQKAQTRGLRDLRGVRKGGKAPGQQRWGPFPPDWALAMEKDSRKRGHFLTRSGGAGESPRCPLPSRAVARPLLATPLGSLQDAGQECQAPRAQSRVGGAEWSPPAWRRACLACSPHTCSPSDNELIIFTFSVAARNGRLRARGSWKECSGLVNSTGHGARKQGQSPRTGSRQDRHWLP